MLLSPGLVSTNLKCVMDASFKIKFTATIKKNGEMTQRYPKSYFSVLFLGWKVQTYVTVLLIPLQTRDIKGCRLAQRFRVGSVVISSEKMLWFEYGQILFFIFIFLFFNVNDNFWVVYYYQMLYLTSLPYIDLVSYVHFETKHNLYSNEHACIKCMAYSFTHTLNIMLFF